MKKDYDLTKENLFPGVDPSKIHHHHIGQGRLTIPVLGEYHNQGKYDVLWHDNWKKVSSLFTSAQAGPINVMKQALVKDLGPKQD